MAHHEQCGPQEVFLGNTPRDGKHWKFLLSNGLKTIRQGEVAFDIDGKPLPITQYAPVFINRNEADRHNAIMMELTFGPYWQRG